MTTILIAALCIGTFIFAAGLIALAAAHWRDRRDFDGEDYEPPRKNFWRDGE
jgi:transcriptional regulator GlxA family with amidase domain